MSGNNDYNYDDEIDLYGDVVDSIPPSKSTASGSGGSKPADSSNNDAGKDSSNAGAGGSSIPTFISEARGGTGVIPPRDEFGRDQHGGANGSGNNQQHDRSSGFQGGRGGPSGGYDQQGGGRQGYNGGSGSIQPKTADVADEGYVDLYPSSRFLCS